MWWRRNSGLTQILVISRQPGTAPGSLAGRTSAKATGVFSPSTIHQVPSARFG